MYYPVAQRSQFGAGLPALPAAQEPAHRNPVSNCWRQDRPHPWAAVAHLPREHHPPEKPEQEKTYIFEYGVNIIALTRVGGAWELETVSAPFVRHSHKISVKHPKVSGEFEVAKVVSATNDDGFIRTKIYF